MTAAATPIDFRDKTEARKLRVLRQNWQIDAANYVDALPELSFAYRFLAHASSRMRYYPALVNPEQPDGPPIPVDDYPDAPPGLADSMKQALAELGRGRLAMSPLQKSLSYQFGVPGEAYLVGMDDPPDGGDKWKIRSFEEFQVFDDAYKLREVPMDPQGTLGWIDLDPSTTFAARMWVPHWRFQKMATSPMRSLLDVSEELLLLSRDVRATARSRLAGGGILKIPEGLRMASFSEDDSEGESEEWFAKFAEAMMTPLTDEGVASAVVPIGISGDAESLSQLDHLIIDRPYSSLAIELRAEAIGRLATGLDVPREVLEGISDPNHWAGWLVSDDTFRHHIEPQVIEQVDAMTLAYMRTWLAAAKFPQFWIDRACIWYDPVDLISKPDPMANALPLWDREAISNATLREAGGFSDADAPNVLELEQRMLLKTRTVPPNVYLGIMHAMDPNLQFPPLQAGGVLPGMGPKGEIPVPPPPGSVAAPPAEALPGPDAAGPTPAALPAETPPTAGTPSLPAGPASTPAAPPPPTGALPNTPAPLASVPAPFAAAPRSHQVDGAHTRLSRRLTELDAQLRGKVQVAACGAMTRLLDRAGAKLRTTTTQRKFKHANLGPRIQGVPNLKVAATLTEPIVASLGFSDPYDLLSPDWSDLKAQFTAWVTAAQNHALTLAATLAKLPNDHDEIAKAEAILSASVGPAWAALETELNQIATTKLYNPDPNSAEVVVDPNTVVPVGVVRRALAIAGGQTTAPVTAAGQRNDPAKAVSVDARTLVDDDPDPAMISVEVPAASQIGSGSAIGALLSSDASNVQAVSYEWVHGPSMRPFEPHEDLDGTEFTSFTDDALANPDSFPENSYYFPGDHDGCSCDFSTTYGPADSDDDSDDDSGGPGLGGLLGEIGGAIDAATGDGSTGGDGGDPDDDDPDGK